MELSRELENVKYERFSSNWLRPDGSRTSALLRPPSPPLSKPHEGVKPLVPEVFFHEILPEQNYQIVSLLTVAYLRPWRSFFGKYEVKWQKRSFCPCAPGAPH